MIVSASRRTDIPAFFSEWFMERIRAEFFVRVNPFNRRQQARVSLNPATVQAICFWSKAPRPLLQYLSELDQRGHNYYFQFTLNAYGKELEPHLPPFTERIDQFTELAARIGPERVIWRYDPIIVSSGMPISWHLEQTARIATLLRGATRRLVFSFCDYYGRRGERLRRSLGQNGSLVDDFTAAEQATERSSLLRGLKALADSHELEIVSCGESLDFSPFGIAHGACIDGALIRKLFGAEHSGRKDKYQRPACGCAESVDMGAYNTCRFRCRYCYANYTENLVERNCRNHRPAAPTFLALPEGASTRGKTMS